MTSLLSDKSDLLVVEYVDADYAGDLDDRGQPKVMCSLLQEDSYVGVL